MATDYFQDYELYGMGQALPTPSDTPYQTPMILPSSSRRSSRRGTPMSPSLPPLPPDSVARIQDAVNDESVSILDPRKITPTLHASLVAEILSVRRELDAKHKFIENLESNLQIARAENNALNEKLVDTAREGQSVRWQLQRLEGGTLSVMEDLAKERDCVKMANADLKGKLEASERKIRGLEDAADRNQTLWEMDKEAWTAEKRSMQRRVHITEARLKTVLGEVAAHNEVSYLQDHSAESESEDDPWDSGLGNESDTNSVQSTTPRKSSNYRKGHSRTISNNSHRSFRHSHRYSVLSGAGSEAHGRGSGLCLADELEFDEDEENCSNGTGDDEDDYPEHAARVRRAIESRQSTHQDEKAKRILGLLCEERSSTSNAVELAVAEPVEHQALENDGFVQLPTLLHVYVDIGVQYSPPPSPPPIPVVEVHDNGAEMTAPVGRVEADQNEQQDSLLVLDRSSSQIVVQERKSSTTMVSSASQTMSEPLNSAMEVLTPSGNFTTSAPEGSPMRSSASTQTELSEPKQSLLTNILPPNSAPPLPPLLIPSIAIHPPSTAPSSPREARLPPGTKNVSCQTIFSSLIPMRSTSMQTEEIRIDQRRIKLPPHLLPSAIDSLLAESLPAETQVTTRATEPRNDTASYPWHSDNIQSSPPVPPSDLRIEHRYPGNNDNGLLVLGRGDGIRRPFRTASLFAGFDNSPAADAEHADEAHLSDDAFKPVATVTRTLSGRTLKHVRPFTNPPTPVPEDKEVASHVDASDLNSGRSQSSGLRSARGSPEKPAKVTKPLRTGGLPRQPNMRRAAIIQSGAAAQLQNRSRSPSLGSIASSKLSYQSAQPPFPVPARSSSRRTWTFSRSEGAQSPTPRSNNTFSGRRLTLGRRTDRKDNLRKVRSVAAIPRHPHQRSQSPVKASSNAPGDSGSVQSPGVDVTIAGRAYIAQRLSDKLEPTSRTSMAPDGSNDQSAERNTVVDAIAATMVGEWMWKYVRRRMSFGAQEPTRDVGSDAFTSVTGNGVRHKRWVWLSPYERSVMWSSKQPTSGSALVGKSGRKLIIKSVLDVKDDTPLPKSAGPRSLFNRSMIILTPSRALKFTAVSQERHYLWLTALSFLAHSAHSSPELTRLPSVPELDPEQLRHSQPALLRPASSRGPLPFSSDKSTTSHELQRVSTERHEDVPLDKAASPPLVPRFSVHGRKRSSTGPRLPPLSHLSLRSFSSQVAASSSTTSSSTHGGPSIPSSLRTSVLADSSGRNSEANSSVRSNFFNTVGTVRMEAFVEPRASEETTNLSVRGGRRRRNSQWSSSTNDRRRSGVVFGDDFDAMDPFRGF